MATYAPETNSADLTALAGWLSMELAVHVAEQAFEAGDYSRAGIINAARNIDYVSPLAMAGGVGQMNAEDAFYAEATGLVQWSDAAVGFERLGDIIDYNGSLGTYTP
jgi:hypothetical protein